MAKGDIESIKQALENTPAKLVNKSSGETIQEYSNLVEAADKLESVQGGATSINGPTAGNAIVNLVGGAGAGVGFGASFGSIVPGVGTAAGAALGGALGYAGAALGLWNDYSKAKEEFDKDSNRKIYNALSEGTNTGIKVDTDIAAKGNSLSGEGIIKLQEVPESSIVEEDGAKITKPLSWNEDGTLKVDLNPLYQLSDRYKNDANLINENYAGLTRENDTDGKILDELNSYLAASQTQYLFHAQSAAFLENQYPGSSAEAIDKAINIQFIGYVGGEEEDKNWNVTIWKDGSQVETTAANFFNSFYDMGDDKVAKDSYLGSLSASLDDPTLSQDDKVVIQGMIDGIYAASNREDSKYSGMVTKDWADYVGQLGIVGFTINDIVSAVSGGQSHGNLDYFLDDQAKATIMGLTSVATNTISTLGVMNGIEKGIAGISKLGLGAVAKVGGGTRISEWALKGIDTLNDAKAVTTSWTGKQALVKLGLDVAADTTFDLTRYQLAQKAGLEMNFWEEYLSDLGMDMLFTYAHTAMFKNVLAKRGINSYTTADAKEFLANGKMVEKTNADGVKYYQKVGADGKTVVAEIYPDGEAAPTKVSTTATKDKTFRDKANQKARDVVIKIMDSKFGSIYKTFFDRDIDIRELGWKAAGNTDDTAYIYKTSNYADSVAVKTQVMQDFFTQQVGNLYKKADQQVSKIIGFKLGRKELSEAQNNYIRVHQQLLRAEQTYGVDSDIYQNASKVYSKYIKAIPLAERKQLDEFSSTLSKIIEAANDFAIQAGIVSEDDAAKMNKYTGYVPLYSTREHLATTNQIIGKWRQAYRKYDSEDYLLESPENFISPYEATTKLVSGVISNVAHNKQVKTVLDTLEAVGDIEVVGTGEVDGLADMEPTEIVSKYNIPKKVQAKLHKQADTKDSYIASLTKLAEDNYVNDMVQEFLTVRDKIVGGKHNTDIGAYKAGITAEEAIGIFTDQLYVGLEGMLRDGVALNSKKGNKTTLNVGNTVERIIATVELDGMSISEEELQALVLDPLKKAVEFTSYDELINRYARSTPEYQRQLDDDHYFERGFAYYDASTDEKVMGDHPGYPIKVYTDGEAQVVYVRGRNAKYDEKARVIAQTLNAPMPIDAKNAFTRIYRGILRRTAQAKQLGLTGGDVTRIYSNLSRDRHRAWLSVGDSAILNPVSILKDMINSDMFKPEDLAEVYRELDRLGRFIRGRGKESVITEIGRGDEQRIQAELRKPDSPSIEDQLAGGIRKTKRQAKYQFDTVVADFRNIKQGGITDLLSHLGDMVENSTRTKVGQNEFLLSFLSGIQSGKSLEEAMADAYEQGAWAAKNATTNFGTKGTFTKWAARYAPYSFSGFSSKASFLESFMIDPMGVSSRMVQTMIVYGVITSMMLCQEDTRRKYMNFSEYQRTHNLVLPLDNNTVVLLPIDEDVMGYLSPMRTMIEALWTKSPKTAWTVFGSFADMLTLDLSGFTEGDKFNLARGFERMGSDYLPTAISFAGEVLTGRDWYYGSEIKVDNDYLAKYGEVADSAGDFTTTSKNSKTLHSVSDFLGIPQWVLQRTLSTYGGNVGEYILNALDKLQGATTDEQGGKDFMNAVFKPIVGTDTDMEQQFRNGIASLQEERERVINKLNVLERRSYKATDEEKSNIDAEKQQLIKDFAMKTNSWLNEYLSVYELTGGVTYEQAQSIYYLFDFSDAPLGSSFTSDSVGASYADKLGIQENSETNFWATQGLGDNYKNLTQYGKLYKNADTGLYERKPTFGEKVIDNDIKGRTQELVVAAENIIKRNNLYNQKQAVQDQISAIFDAANQSGKSPDYDAIDKLRAQWDAKAMTYFLPFFEKNGIDVVNKSKIIDVLDDYFLVIGDFERDKRGRYISAPDLNKQRGFAQSFIETFYNKLQGGK